ncbi:hypothetical protein [Pelagicoccus sp. SDUM812002]|uniref:hypothetical protein n=1 Tax=Pelagicoccus sp. SDUM812002 TaxID=3041266 RepID=UPI00280C7F49|nr:hypothetical protein [Pelagicoccus sp. SDUM812002]MDQ8186214.1 hypothetical protein [Pelagicoccus sp. SDUM812002]
MKDDIGKEIEIDLENGECIQIKGTKLGEPEKALIVERALELAALKSRRGAPESEDFEDAARDLSADAKVVDRGDATRLELSKSSEAADSAQVLNQESSDDEENTARSAQRESESNRDITKAKDK